ncbi:holin [Leuconostoc mesenteroides subsp. cremoris]|uniref:holin n=2 Tax=Leuconostoc mesenteroides TaxID=1245 RepID=UPI000A008B5F|nr:holin [Leuconostoc mesenteroides]ORI39628.1 holin [Leuconostoc mesenteroides subsp. cremoris]
MDTNTITKLITTIAIAAIPIIGAYVSKVILGNKQVVNLIQVLSPLAKDAVVAMQKLGVTEFLEGEAKKSGAVKIVTKSLTALGFSDADETLIKNAVEKEYALLINELDQTYPQMTAEQAKAQEAATQQASEVAKAQQALADAQTKVSALQN